MEKADMEILTPDQILKKQLAMESTRSYVYTHVTPSPYGTLLPLPLMS